MCIARVINFSFHDLSHTMRCTITFNKIFQWHPLYFHTMSRKVFGKLLGLVGHSQNMARSNGEVIVGIMQFVFLVDGNNMITTLMQIVNKRVVVPYHSILGFILSPGIDFYCKPLFVNRLGI